MSLPSLIFTIFLLIATTPTKTHSFSISSYQSLLSISHSLASRVATLRSTRGDFSGAARARNFARTIEPGLNLGFFRFAMKLGWDYVRNYSWWWGGSGGSGSFGNLAGVLSDLNELSGVFAEFGGLGSGAERVGRNYEAVLRVSRRLLERILALCRQSGPLREVVEALERELLDGELLKDCLELGADDLKGLILALKDIAFQYGSASSRTEL